MEINNDPKATYVRCQVLRYDNLPQWVCYDSSF